MLDQKKTVQLFVKCARVIVLVIMIIFFSVASDTFMTTSNIKNIITQQVPFLLILSISMTMAIILKGIDLSLGTVLALSSCVAAMVLKITSSPVLCILAGLGIGALCGTVNGFLIAQIGVSPYIATYTVQWVTKGTAYVLLAGKQVYDFPDGFRELFIGSPYTLLLIAAVVAVIMWFVMNRTTFGRNVYAVGNNPEAAKLSGVNVKMIYIVSFLIIGFLSSLTGLMYIANLGAAEPIIGDNFAIRAIAATLIGGTSFGGGKGSVQCAILGAFIMNILTNGLLHLGANSYWQQVAIGVVIVLAIFFERAVSHLANEET